MLSLESITAPVLDSIRFGQSEYAYREMYIFSKASPLSRSASRSSLHQSISSACVLMGFSEHTPVCVKEIVSTGRQFGNGSPKNTARMRTVSLGRSSGANETYPINRLRLGMLIPFETNSSASIKALVITSPFNVLAYTTTATLFDVGELDHVPVLTLRILR